MLPNDVAGIGEMLRLNGYSTGAFGKWHETAVWEISPSGPFARWPNLQGFDEFYGFMGGETNQWSPGLFHNQNQVETPDDPDYHFMNDMATKSIEWIRFQQALTPDKPFFVYFAPGAVHAPHHVPQSYIDKWKGKFDEGWDVIRQRIFEQQKKLGVIPADTKLAKKPDDIKDWKDLSAKEKKLFARQAEVFAAYLEMADHETGRFIQAIEDMGEIDNTLIFYIAGDNGTSAEGGMNGLYNEMTYFNNVPKGSDIDFMLQALRRVGRPEHLPAHGGRLGGLLRLALHLDQAGGLQLRRHPQRHGRPLARAASRGRASCAASGTTSSTSCPPSSRPSALPQPRIVNGVPQRPIEGTSMVYTWDYPNAPDRHQIQYFEMFGNRGIYFDGWFAGTVHLKPWGKVENRFPEDTWELYHVKEDFSMSTDLAKKHPEILAKLQEVFLGEAVKYKVLPLDDRRQELFNPKLAGRPDLMFGRKSLTLYEGMTGLLENDFINIKNTSFEIVADVEIRRQAGQRRHRVPGRSLRRLEPVREGRQRRSTPTTTSGIDLYTATATEKLPSGKSTVKMDFAYDGGDKPGAGGTATLYINGKSVGSGKVEAPSSRSSRPTRRPAWAWIPRRR